jgi:hypothetical protein
MKDCVRFGEAAEFVPAYVYLSTDYSESSRNQCRQLVLATCICFKYRVGTSKHLALYFPHLCLAFLSNLKRLLSELEVERGSFPQMGHWLHSMQLETTSHEISLHPRLMGS